MLLIGENKFDFVTPHPLQSRNIAVDSNPLRAKDYRTFGNSALVKGLSAQELRNIVWLIRK